jgi:allantoate deiminase
MITRSGDPETLADLADEALRRCDQVARYSEQPGAITRTFLSEPMRRLHQEVGRWMTEAGLDVRVDAAGNLIGEYAGLEPGAGVVAIGSHLDTVPDAGKYDGVLGVMLGLAAVQALGGRRFPFAINVIAFSEEEGVRYRSPFLGSLAAVGRFDRGLFDRADGAGITMSAAFRDFGLDPDRIDDAAYPIGKLLAYVEPHIEQGPVLERLGAPVGVVDAIAGQSRLWVEARGRAAHAGTTPMEGRHDALAAAAQVVLEVERMARATSGLIATVGALAVEPGASNVVPARVRFSIDVRHARDSVRTTAVTEILASARELAQRRGVALFVSQEEHHAAVPADPVLSGFLGEAVAAAGHTPHRVVSGAGHDAGVMAAVAPMAMLFLRCPGGVSHHPDERVLASDVTVALEVLVRYLDILAARIGPPGRADRPAQTVGAA